MAQNTSKRSVSYGLSRFGLASGDIIFGWCIKKIGLCVICSKNYPTKKSIKRLVVYGELGKSSF